MIPIIIMAGGRGLRLHPLTSHAPKPLLPVGGKPILEQIVTRCVKQGFKRIWLAVNYKADLIESYFGNGAKWGCKIRYLYEDKELGTGGAVKLLPKFETPFIVQNADVLSSIEYGDLMESHARSNAEATVALALHQHQLEYGVADFRDGEFIGIREKPIEDFQVNAGIYVLEPHVPGYGPDGPFDMPDLIAHCDKISAYAIEGWWTDVGTFLHYAKVNAEWRH